MSLLPIHRASPVFLCVCFLSFCGHSPIAAQHAPAPAATEAHLVLTASDGQDYTREADFGPDGQLVLNVNVADIAFHRGEPGKLKLVIDPRSAARADEASSWVREFTVSRQHAKLELKMPKNDNHQGDHSPHIDVYLPEKTSVKLDVDVGNVEVAALAGDLELAIGIGNVDIHALDRDKYHDVNVSVNMGDISDDVFGMNPSGMLGKDANFHGDGPWKIKLRARIGNIQIHTRSSSGHSD